MWRRHQGRQRAWRCALQLVLTVFGARWILLLVEAAFFEELAETAWHFQQRLVLDVFGEADSALPEAAAGLPVKQRLECLRAASREKDARWQASVLPLSRVDDFLICAEFIFWMTCLAALPAAILALLVAVWSCSLSCAIAAAAVLSALRHIRKSA